MTLALRKAIAVRNLSQYGLALDAGLTEKWRALAPWIDHRAGGDILDIGCGTGLLASRIAAEHPACRVLGVDASATMVRMARQRHGGPANLVFWEGAASGRYSERAGTVVMSSLLHEVYSYSQEGQAAVENVIRSAWDSLLPGGRLIIRDFVRPSAGDRRILMFHRRTDITAGRDLTSFVRASPHPVQLYARHANRSCSVYETDLATAYEYLLRKGYHEMWESELAERYGFWTFEQAGRMMQNAGFDVVHRELLHNAWITSHNINGKIRILNSAQRPVSFAPYQILIVGEKRSEAFNEPMISAGIGVAA